MKGVGAEHQETLSVPLLREMTCGPNLVPPLCREIRGGHHGLAVLHLSKREKDSNLWSRKGKARRVLGYGCANIVNRKRKREDYYAREGHSLFFMKAH